MTSFLQRISRTRKAPSAVLGLAFDGRRVVGTLLRRTPDGLRPSGAFEADLSADFDGANSEALGRELRARLDEAGLKERQCAVAVPVRSLWVTQTGIPAMSEADAQDLLQLEAEKGFHTDASTLHVASSQCTLPDGSQWATLAALPQARLASLERLLAAARLKPVSIGADLVELQPPASDPPEGAITLKLGQGSGSIGLQATAGREGLLALRSFEGVSEDAEGRPVLEIDSVAREIRITLAQLPEPWGRSLRDLRIHGPQALAQALADGLSARLALSGFRVQIAPRASTMVSMAPMSATGSAAGTAGLPGVSPASVSAVVAARVLSGTVPATLEFLPPKPSVLQQFLVRHAQGPRRTAWAVCGGLATVAVLAFGVQQVRLSLLESRWGALSGKVRELERIQEDLRLFRPWTTGSARGLAILEALTSAFPENGSVTAKAIEIRESGEVVCSGTATDSPAFLAMTARLGSVPGVSRVHHDQSRGSSPLQFNLRFVWEGGQAR